MTPPPAVLQAGLAAAKSLLAGQPVKIAIGPCDCGHACCVLDNALDVAEVAGYYMGFAARRLVVEILPRGEFLIEPLPSRTDR